MMERVVTFGPRCELVGILALPEGELTAAERPAVLMWNVGVNHRVGPFRIYVELARRLAEAGFIALRFDASGLGDSEVRREAVRDSERALFDLRDAMDFVTRRTGVRSFVLVGFCSSVDAAHRAAVADPRVVGVIQLEAYAYRTRGFKLHAARDWLGRARWERFLRRKAGELLPQLFEPLSLAAGPEPVYKRELPTWDAFTRELALLTQRKVALLFAYGGDTDFNHPGQFWEMFGSSTIDRSYLDVEFMRQADHTFFDLSLRRQLIAAIRSWLEARFARALASASAEETPSPQRDHPPK